MMVAMPPFYILTRYAQQLQQQIRIKQQESGQWINVDITDSDDTIRAV